MGRWSRNRRTAANRPETRMGRWLVAIAKNDPASSELQGDDDEATAFVLLDAAFTLAVRRVLSPEHDVGVITDLIRHVRERYPAAMAIRTVDAEALVRAALGEDVAVDGIDVAAAFNIKCFVFTELVHTLKLSATELDELVAKAEAVARE